MSGQDAVGAGCSTWWEITWDYNGGWVSPFTFMRDFSLAEDTHQDSLRRFAHDRNLEDGLERYAWIKRFTDAPHDAKLFRFRYVDNKFTCSEVDAPVQPYVKELCAGGAS